MRAGNQTRDFRALGTSFTSKLTGPLDQSKGSCYPETIALSMFNKSDLPADLPTKRMSHPSHPEFAVILIDSNEGGGEE